jgi:hypothetical protein
MSTRPSWTMRHYARPVIAFAPLGPPWRFDMSVGQKAISGEFPDTTTWPAHEGDLRIWR